MKHIVICMFLFFLCCNKPHKSAEDIYSTGRIENINDFKRIDHGEDTLKDVYQYLYDTNFTAEKSYGLNRESVRGYAFNYKGKKVGKWIIHNYSGILLGEVNFRDDKYDGFFLVYNADGSLKNKELYKDGTLIYTVTYTDKGVKIDSVAH